jgi:hypothetical protein
MSPRLILAPGLARYTGPGPPSLLPHPPRPGGGGFSPLLVTGTRGISSEPFLWLTPGSRSPTRLLPGD